MKKTLQCYECKQQFLRESLTGYAMNNAKTLHNYCPDCLEKVKARERFSQKVCEIFNISTPGPRIWAERKRLMNTYGYTDQIIIDCLDYIYNVDGKKKLSESLCMIKPAVVERMLKYKKAIEYKVNKIASTFVNGLAMSDVFNTDTTTATCFIKPRENMKEKKQTTWDNDNYLFME